MLEGSALWSSKASSNPNPNPNPRHQRHLVDGVGVVVVKGLVVALGADGATNLQRIGKSAEQVRSAGGGRNTSLSAAATHLSEVPRSVGPAP